MIWVQRIVVFAFALAIGFFTWSIIYGLMLQIFFQSGTILTALTKNPLVAVQQLWVYHDNKSLQLAGIYAAVPSLFLVALLTFLMLRVRVNPLGDAEFAKAADIRLGKMFKRKGMVLGRFGGKVMRVDDDRHHLIIGPTRSGKGINYVVPNMLEFDGSIIVTDLKGELWEQTSAHRQKNGQTVYFFSPGQPQSDTYNPLDFIRNGPGHRTTDIQNMANILIPEDQNSNSAVWQATSRNVLAGLISYVTESEEYEGRRNFGEINSLIKSPIDLQLLLKTIMKAESNLSKFTRDSFNGFCQLTDKAAQSALLDLQRSVNILQMNRSSHQR